MYKSIDSYLKHLGRKSSDNTIVNYRSHITRFVDWLKSERGNLKRYNITQDDVLDYLDTMKKTHSSKSIHAHMNAINGFCGHLYRSGEIKVPPFINSKEMNDYLPVIPEKDVRSLTKAELNLMLLSTIDDPMKHSLIRTFYETGMRVSEIVAIKMSDIEHDFDRIYVHTHGKGKGGMSKYRKVRISQKTFDTIREMVDLRSFESDYLFVSTRTKRPFTTRRIDQIINEIAESVGIQGITTHVFRATIATNLLSNGMSASYVAKYLGHASSKILEKHYFDHTKTIDAKFDEHYDLV